MWVIKLKLYGKTQKATQTLCRMLMGMPYYPIFIRMDQEYLQNVMGSPYVQEGAFSRLKARGAQAMGAIGTMAGQLIQSPAETKLRSLWEDFMSSLKKVMKDWEGVSTNSFGETIKLDEKQQQVKDALDQLVRLMASSVPQKIGTAPDDFAAPGARTQRRNPDTFVKGSAYNRSTTSPPKPISTKLTEILGEGFWNRDIGLNKALGSNDPSTILDSYKNHILGIFKNFMKDAVKMTKMTAQQVYSMLAKMQPAKAGWQAAGNMQKVVEQLKTLQSIGDIKGTGAPPIIQPSGAEGPPAEERPQAPQQPSAQPSVSVSPETPKTPGQAPSSEQGVQGGEGAPVTAQEMPHIILKAIEIINDAIMSDTSHTGKFFDVDKTGKQTSLPSDYGTGQSMTKEITSPPKTHGGEDEPEPEKKEPEDKERKGEFVYNFHSKYRKYPGQNFSIQVKPVNVNPEISPGLSVEVWWNCEATRNKIYAIANAGGKKSPPVLIMEFFDHEVNSKAGATNPKSTNFFSADKIINAANPNGPKKLATASADVLQKIKASENTLLRSLMLTVGRKSMEFKPKKDKTLPMKFDEHGNVTLHPVGKNPEQYTKQQVWDKLNKSDYETSEQWKESLDYSNYFEQFPDMKPKDISEYPEFKDAIKTLMQLNYGEPEATKLAAGAWMELRQDYQNLDDIKSSVIVAKALKKPSATPGKKKESPPGGETPPPEGGAPVESPKSPVSGPVGGPPPSAKPSAPVSGAASGAPPTTDPTAPVSQKKPEPDKGQGQEPQQPPTQEAKSNKKGGGQEVKIWRSKDGQMRWQNKKGVIGGLTSKTIQKLKNKPEFLDALKKAKANKFAPPTKVNPETGKEEPDTSLQEKFINPFQRANFLL